MVPNPFQIVRFNSTYVDLHFNHKISTLMRWTPMNFSLLQHNKHNGVDDSNVCKLMRVEIFFFLSNDTSQKNNVIYENV
jgi:hypothetical protein